jgi:Alginate lyase
VRLHIPGTEGPFVDDTATAYGLALAYVMTGERKYGEAAARYIMAWVDTTTSTRDTCKDTGACQTSLIISRTVPGFVFAADLLEGSGYLDDASLERFRAWLRDVMLPTASELNNNWGDAGTFTRVVVTDYLGDQSGFDAAIKKWRELLDLIKPDGHIPAEVARGRGGIGYTQEALDYKVAVAVIAERRGVDLWAYEGAGGASLKSAVDYLATYMAHPKRWPWDPNVRRWGPSPFWELAYSHWHDPEYGRLVLERRPQGNIGHSAIRWTTLTNGIPVT